MDKVLKRLKGFQKAPRDRFLLLAMRELTQEEFLLYELGIALADWDETHDGYGTFSFTNQELTKTLGWKSDSTVSRHKKNLIQKELFLIRADGSIEPILFEQWQLRKKEVAKSQKESAEMQGSSAYLQESSAEMHEKQAQTRTYSLGSYKDNIGSFALPSFYFKTSEQLTNDELQQIFPGAMVEEVRNGEGRTN